ncbi:alpha/beta hydrolase [Nocardia cyriacigeorgica]|uniref:Alpha/beta hydrolase n=1 Tax=Nocardia cyriacigeorgica TaxID=135487 RepID=A0A6P1DFU8_9NOCA|nr:alpha/beta hydrolase [Nocardia cyriacigeorgica]NEW42580.1 alpha/beta hydrolase [Nocardia cyriacigeorgica]NEW47282.1 alpha/beta hydrolase [Nocardia cyriacigeorgica]NEW53685.1 alpha/beta hydrolase [Nocardia cyriacigeorgica]NEW58837.1 alpha/beta hydrolase [Nocardia cyriacigeorgica]
MGISPSLGRIHDVELPAGRIRYHDTGDGPPVVFVHGVLVNGDLWRKVVPEVAAAGHRCLTPDWPLGSHTVAMPGADLTPAGVADIIATFLECLDLTDVTIVANDTGGAITQILMTRNPARIGRVVLASVDCYDKFFPQPFTLLGKLAQLPGSVRPVTEFLRIRALHRLPLAFGWVAKRPIPDEIVDSYLLPSRTSAAIRKDARRFLKSANSRYTLDAATRFPSVTFPVLLVWAREEKLFPVPLAERMAGELPDATLKFVDDAYTFLPEDQPEQLTQHILEFLRERAVR